MAVLPTDDQDELGGVPVASLGSVDQKFQELSLQVMKLSEDIANVRQKERRPMSQRHYRSQNRYPSPNQGTRRKYAYDPPVCWACGKRGHIKRNCPENRAMRSACGISSAQFPQSTNSINPSVTVEGLLLELPVQMLVDTGSAVTLIDEKIWKRLQANQSLETAPTCPIVAANGERLHICGKSILPVVIGEVAMRHPFIVVRELAQECILGADFLQACGCIIDLGRRTLNIEGQEIPLDIYSGLSACRAVCEITTTIPGHHEVEVGIKIVPLTEQYSVEQTALFFPAYSFMERHDIVLAHSLHSIGKENIHSLVRVLNPSSDPVVIHSQENMGNFQPLIASEVATCTLSSKVSGGKKEISCDIIEKLEKNTVGLSTSQKHELRQLLSSYADVISCSSSDLGKTKLAKHKINTGQATPIKQPFRRIPFHQRDVVESMLKDMSQRGIIEPSSSPWSSPIVLVKKKRWLSTVLCRL